MVDALSVESLNVDYGQTRVVHDVSFQAQTGQILGLLGPNGAGKTSLLKAIAGLIPSSGHISFHGEPLASFSYPVRAQRLAYVPQRSQLSARLTVEQVVAQGRFCHGSAFSGTLAARDRQTIAQALHQVDVTSLTRRIFTELSGGEQRRVLLARALATEANTILLDEPTASLDIAHALNLFVTLTQLAKEGRCIVCVLHDLKEARDYCHQLLLLQNGRIHALGSPESVVEPVCIKQVYGVELLQQGGLSFRLPEAAQ